MPVYDCNLRITALSTLLSPKPAPSDHSHCPLLSSSPFCFIRSIVADTHRQALPHAQPATLTNQSISRGSCVQASRTRACTCARSDAQPATYQSINRSVVCRVCTRAEFMHACVRARAPVQILASPPRGSDGTSWRGCTDLSTLCRRMRYLGIGPDGAPRSPQRVRRLKQQDGDLRLARHSAVDVSPK
jgi:hypothetical protein